MPLLIYSLGFAWGFVLLASFAGWGLVVGRWLREDGPPDWGLAIARGIALLVAIGGFLNGLGVISAGLVLSLVGIGLVILAARVLRPSSGERSEGTWGRGRLGLPPIDGL